MPLLLSDREVEQVMTMQECVQVMDDVFQQAGRGLTWNRPRSRIRVPRGFHYLMAAADEAITLFESQGVTISDLAAPAYVYQKAKERELDTELPLSE